MFLEFSELPCSNNRVKSTNPQSVAIKFIAFFFVVLFVISCTNSKNKNSLQSDSLPSQDNVSEDLIGGELMGFIDDHFAVIAFVSPECEYCQYQIKALLSEHDEKPEPFRLLFLSGIHADSLRSFADQFEYDEMSTLFLTDQDGKMAEQMSVNSYPTMFLYDNNGKYIQTIVGEAKPSYVYKFFHEPQ